MQRQADSQGGQARTKLTQLINKKKKKQLVKAIE